MFEAILKLAEKGEWDNRELDCLIFEHRRPEFTPDMRGSYYGEFTGEYFRNGDRDATAPNYSSDLTKALDLVKEMLPGWSVLLAITPTKTVCDIHSKPLGDAAGTWPGHAEASTPPPAVLLGLFRALVAVGPAR